MLYRIIIPYIRQLFLSKDPYCHYQEQQKLIHIARNEICKKTNKKQLEYIRRSLRSRNIIIWKEGISFTSLIPQMIVSLFSLDIDSIEEINRGKSFL